MYAPLVTRSNVSRLVTSYINTTPTACESAFVKYEGLKVESAVRRVVDERSVNLKSGPLGVGRKAQLPCVL